MLAPMVSGLKVYKEGLLQTAILSMLDVCLSSLRIA